LGFLQWIAYVDVNAEHDHARVNFAEDVAVSRGANMRLFASVSDAQRWLRAELGQKGLAS
jgi:hypothetical protein